ncbi:MAG: hypothetical protein ACP5SH_00365 [Syntrophobacteraceae bacterium]
MLYSVADTVVEFIRTQEEADRLCKMSELAQSADEAAQYRIEAERLQRKADRLLSRYRSMKRP